MSGNSGTNISSIEDEQQTESDFGENARYAEKKKTAYQGYGFSEVFIILTKFIINEHIM